VKEMVSTMLREKDCMEINAISLSNNTVQHSTGEIAKNNKEQMTTRTQSSCFYVLQLDKIKDITELSYHLQFVKYNFNKNMNEDLIFCMSVHRRETSHSIFCNSG
jgi:hypothetical protein